MQLLQGFPHYLNCVSSLPMGSGAVMRQYSCVDFGVI